MIKYQQLYTNLKNQAMGAANNATCIEWYGESDGISAGPQKKTEIGKFYIPTPDQPPPAAYYVH